MRVSKYTAACLGCGAALTIYPRHVRHKEPIPCPECGRLNSADEFDLSEQMRAESRELAKLLGKPAKASSRRRGSAGRR